MVAEIEAEIAAIATQDPRTPISFRRSERPLRRMDSPLYRIALRHVARATRPRGYLEIGVKEGVSLAIVLDASDRLERLVLCDFFTVNAKRHAFRDSAAAEIERRDFRGRVRWMDGSSTVTVPSITEAFDLVGVDGSHRRAICAADLRNVRPLVEPGGHVVVDDLILFEDCRLERVFDAFAEQYADAWSVVYKNTSFWPGVGVLRRDL